MADFKFKYGDGEQCFSYPDEDIIAVVEPAKVEIPAGTEEEKALYALEHPMDCPPLEETVTAEDTCVILVPDTTRQWSHPAAMLKVLVAKLNKIGVPDEHILIVSAVGTHKKQTPAEHISIVGEDIYKRIKVVDHDCDSNLVKVGTSFRGNDIWVNATVMQYTKKFICAGTVFHFLAGFGGSRKYVLPGIAGRDTIMNNHSEYFAPGGVGSGRNLHVNPGAYSDDNPINREMFEAMDMVGIDFNMTSVMGPDKQIAFCYAGDPHTSHAAAVEKCRMLDGAEVDELADMVITCGMGFPKDINLYQTTAKPMINALGAKKEDPNSVMIVVSKCQEGIGNPDTVMMLNDFDNAYDREVYTRANYTIGLNVAYMLTAFGEQFHTIVVSSIPADAFKKSKIHACSTVTEAIELAHKLTGKEHLSCTLLPYGANTCTSLKQK